MQTRRLLVVLALSALPACHKKPAVASNASRPPAPDAGRPSDEAVRTGLPERGAASRLSTVYFALDASTLDATARGVLDHDAELLRRESAIHVRVEGHADERGSTQYNAALGERRASAVRKYLEAEGVPRAQMDTVSYGEERPADPGHDDAAWARNRRVELFVTSGQQQLLSSY